MAANLIVPQVQVKWGSVDLTDPTSNNLPSSLVYDVSVELSSQTQWPTGSMLWSPAGPAFQKFIELSKNNTFDTISVRFFYVDGPEITFYFNYGGMRMGYGNRMDMQVFLNCVKAQNSVDSKRSFAQNNSEKFTDKGIDALEHEKQVSEYYGSPVKVIWSDCAKASAKKTKIQQAYAKDSTFGSQLQQLAQEGGNTITYSNMTEEGVAIIQCPLTWEGEKKLGEVEIPKNKVEPGKRYGWLLGPGIIDTFSRSFQWQPPTQDNTQQASDIAALPQSSERTTQKIPGQDDMPQNKKEKSKGEKKKKVKGPTSPNTERGKKYSENPDAGAKKQYLNEEGSTQISADLFMTPSILGITPDDVIYVPSLKQTSDFIEDYKVTSVTYNQSGAQFNISVQGTRVYGINKPMWKEAAEKFLKISKTLRTVDDWTRYAWNLNRGETRAEIATGDSKPVTPQTGGFASFFGFDFG